MIVRHIVYHLLKYADRIIDQGTTPRLSKVWMPLSEFTPLAMQGLLHGDMQIPVGKTAKQWEKYEKGKIVDVVEARHRATHIKQEQRSSMGVSD